MKLFYYQNVNLNTFWWDNYKLRVKLMLHASLNYNYEHQSKVSQNYFNQIMFDIFEPNFVYFWRVAFWLDLHIFGMCVFGLNADCRKYLFTQYEKITLGYATLSKVNIHFVSIIPFLAQIFWKRLTPSTGDVLCDVGKFTFKYKSNPFWLIFPLWSHPGSGWTKC